MKKPIVNQGSRGSSLVRLVALLQEIDAQIKVDEQLANNQSVKLKEHQVIGRDGEIIQL